MVSSCFRTKNFRQPAANMLSTSLSACWWNVSLRPKYFCDSVCGSISTLRPCMVVCSGCCLGCRCSWLCKIFVLSGCNSRPTAAATRWMSRIMGHSWRRLVAMSITSSAKRKLVNGRPAKSSRSPHPRRLQVGITCLKMCSERVLKRRELRGSPCFVPRSMLNSLLVLSVCTVAVWLS